MSKDMKLIMENFKRAMNEQMGGIGMPLKTGVATAAGKTEKAMEDERHRVFAHNARFLRELESMGDEPEFIEIEPGDIMGIDLRELKELLNKEALRVARHERFEIRNGNLIPLETFDAAPTKISPNLLSDILKTVLRDKDLWYPESLMNTRRR